MIEERTEKRPPIGRTPPPAPRVSGIRDALKIALHHTPALGAAGDNIAAALKDLLERIDRNDKEEAA